MKHCRLYNLAVSLKVAAMMGATDMSSQIVPGIAMTFRSDNVTEDDVKNVWSVIKQYQANGKMIRNREIDELFV